MFIIGRTYEPIYPVSGTISVSIIKEIKEIGAYVSLIEYDFIQGMLMMSELSRRRIRSINKLLKIGKKETVSIIRVDKKKGYIDVSKRQLADGETFAMKKKWFYSKLVCSLSCHISRILFINCEDGRIRWIWGFFRKFGHAVRGFKNIITKNLQTLSGLIVFNSEMEVFSKNLKNKILNNKNKIETKFEMNSYSFRGILFIKEIIKIIEKFYWKDLFSFSCSTAPFYSAVVIGISKRKGLKKFIKILKLMDILVRINKGRIKIIKIDSS
jgi:translation initiation factor 2 subunit 1